MSNLLHEVTLFKEVKERVSKSIQKTAKENGYDEKEFRSHVATESYFSGANREMDGDKLDVKQELDHVINSTGLSTILMSDKTWEQKKDLVVDKLKAVFTNNLGTITKASAVAVISLVGYKLATSYYEKMIFQLSRQSEEEWNIKQLVRTGMISKQDAKSKIYSAPLSHFVKEHGPYAPVCTLEKVGGAYKVSGLNEAVIGDTSKYKVINAIETTLSKLEDYDDFVDKIASSGTNDDGSIKRIDVPKKLWDKVVDIVQLGFIEPEKTLSAIDLAVLSALAEVI